MEAERRAEARSCSRREAQRPFSAPRATVGRSASWRSCGIGDFKPRQIGHGPEQATLALGPVFSYGDTKGSRVAGGVLTSKLNSTLVINYH